MRYKINKSALLRQMAEYEQNTQQRINYLRHTISTLLNINHWSIFDMIAWGYHLYYMLLNEAFQLIRLRYSDYLIIVQSTEHEYIIEIRKYE